MKQLVYMFLLVGMPILATAAGQPFAPYDAARPTINDTLVAVENGPYSEAFWNTLILHHGFDSKEEARELLVKQGELIPCGDGRVDTARALPDDRGQFLNRECYIGEMLVYLDGRPVFSLYCGNPIIHHQVRESVISSRVLPDVEPEKVELTKVCTSVDEYRGVVYHSGGIVVDNYSYYGGGHNSFALFSFNNSGFTIPITESGGRIVCRNVPLTQ